MIGSGDALNVGFVALADAAPLIVAHEIGFAGEEGLSLALHRAPSWSALRDMVAFGQIDAAHMLSPVPVATALGLGGLGVQLDALSVLSVNGNVIGVSAALEARLRAAGFGFDFADARSAGAALIAAAEPGTPLRVGVPFPFSMHAELVYYWLAALGLGVPDALDVRTVPPPLMAAALGRGELDAFCVGEPWGSTAVENGAGALLLPGMAIRAFAPEKVLAVRHQWADADRDRGARLIRAVWRAQRWLGRTENLATASEILARPPYLDVSAEIIERALTGHLTVSGRGETRAPSRFLEFHAGAAGFPWRSEAAWIGQRLAVRLGLDRTEAIAAARAVYRSDLYRAAMIDTGASLPAASERVIGAIRTPTTVAAHHGSLVLEPDTFFDGLVFDPDPPR